MARRDIGLDEMDRRILRILVDDGRTPTTEIARLLDAPESTVRSRIRRLVRENWVQFTAILNTDRWETVFEIFALVRCAPARVDAVAHAFAAVFETRAVRRVIGAAELLVTAGFATDADFVRYQDAMGAVEGVLHCEYFRTTHLYKGQYVLPQGWSERERDEPSRPATHVSRSRDHGPGTARRSP